MAEQPGPNIQLSATVGTTTILLNVPTSIPDQNLGLFDRLLDALVSAIEKQETDSRSGRGRPLTYPQAIQIYDSCKISLRSTSDKIVPTEVYELHVSQASLSTKLLKSRGRDLVTKLEVLAEKVPASLIRSWAKDLTWVLNQLDAIVDLIVDKQSGFLRSGGDLSQLRAIGIKDIAEEVGLHASTVSRLLRQVIVVINGKEFSIRDLLPSTRLESRRLRESVKKLSLDPRYCDGKKWLVPADSLRLVLEELTGQQLSGRTISKYVSETGHKRYSKHRAVPEGTFRQAWRHLYANDSFPPCEISETAKEAAKRFERRRLESLTDKVEQLCAKVNAEDAALAERFVNMANERGFVLVPSDKSLMLRAEPWSPTLLYFKPGRGCILSFRQIFEVQKALTEKQVLSVYEATLGININLDWGKEVFVPLSKITEEHLRSLLILLASSVKAGSSESK